MCSTFPRSKREVSCRWSRCCSALIEACRDGPAYGREYGSTLSLARARSFNIVSDRVAYGRFSQSSVERKKSGGKRSDYMQADERGVAESR